MSFEPNQLIQFTGTLTPEDITNNIPGTGTIEFTQGNNIPVNIQITETPITDAELTNIAKQIYHQAQVQSQSQNEAIKKMVANMEKEAREKAMKRAGISLPVNAPPSSKDSGYEQKAGTTRRRTSYGKTRSHNRKIYTNKVFNIFSNRKNRHALTR
jgi:Tfp pilus assembly protein PilV